MIYHGGHGGHGEYKDARTLRVDDAPACRPLATIVVSWLASRPPQIVLRALRVLRGERCVAVVSACLLVLAVGCPRPNSADKDTAARLPLAGVKLRLLVVDDPALARAVGKVRGEWHTQTGATLELAEPRVQLDLGLRNRLGADRRLEGPSQPAGGGRPGNAQLGEQVRVATGANQLADTGVVRVADGGLGGHAATVARQPVGDQARRQRNLTS